jgi:nicotinate-nucleotide adenylyltransferase
VGVYVYPRKTDINIDQELITNNKINILDAPKIEISSDQIRKRMKEGDDIKSYLPKVVYEYIIEKKII